MTLDARSRRFVSIAVYAVIALLILLLVLSCRAPPIHSGTAPLGPGLATGAGGAASLAVGYLVGGVWGVLAGISVFMGTLIAAARGWFGSNPEPVPHIAVEGPPWWLTFGGLAQVAFTLSLVYFGASMLLSPRYREQVFAFLRNLFTGHLPTATKHLLAASGRMHTSKKTGAPVRRISPKPVSRRPR